MLQGPGLAASKLVRIPGQLPSRARAGRAPSGLDAQDAVQVGVGNGPPTVSRPKVTVVEEKRQKG